MASDLTDEQVALGVLAWLIDCLGGEIEVRGDVLDRWRRENRDSQLFVLRMGSPPAYALRVAQQSPVPQNHS